MKKKNGTSKRAAEARHARFVQAYIAGGENATEAYLAIAPHVTRGSAGVEGHKLLKDPKVHAAVEIERAKLRAKFALTTDRVVQELTRLAYFNPLKLMSKGKKLQLHEIDEDTAAGLTLELDGKGNVLKMRTVPPSAKNTAVKQAVKILRLEDKPPPPPPPEPGRAAAISADPKDTARRMAFLLARGAAAEKPRPPKPVKRKATIAA